MSYKPDNETLISYLYGELEGEELKRVEEYLQKNPEAKAELASLQETSQVLQQYDDEPFDMNIPLIEIERTSEWEFWRKYVAIAATLLLLVTFGWISKFQISYNDNGLFLGFGDKANNLSAQQVSDMIYEDRMDLLAYVQAGLDANSDSLQVRMANFEQNLDFEGTLVRLLSDEKQKMVSQMLALNQNLASDYRELMNEIVLNFSNNIEAQRVSDLRSIQAAFTDLEEATLDRQVNLEDALFSLSERVDAVIANNNNNR